MARYAPFSSSKLHEQFCLRFQRHFCSEVARRHSAAEGFGPAWEKALAEVPLEDTDQAVVYWDLIRRAREGELFTSRASSELLSAWKDTIDEF